MTQAITRAQRKALKAVYDRAPLYIDVVEGRPMAWIWPRPHKRRVTYREFRRTARKSFLGCVMVPWCGMWLGIEEDGYTHS